MKKTLSLFLSIVMLFANIAGTTLNVNASDVKYTTMSTNGSWYEGYISKDNLGDYYKLTLSHDGEITIKVMQYMPTKFDLYNQDLSQNIVNDCFGSGSVNSPETNIVKFSLSKGIYYVRISHASYYYGEFYGKYKINSVFESYANNENEPNDYDHAMNLSSDNIVTGALTIQDDVDWYKIVIPLNSKISVKITRYTECDCELFNEDLSKNLFDENCWYNSGELPKTTEIQATVKKGTYYLKVKKCDHFYGDFCGKYKISWSMNINISKPSTLKVSTRKTTSLKLSWSKVSGVSGYQLQQYKSNKWTTVKNTTANTYTVSKLKAGTKYNFRVRAYKKVNGKYYYSGWTTLTTPTKPATVTISSAKSSKSKSITVKWKSVTCSGYQVQYSTSSKFTSKTTKTAAVKGTAKSKTLSKLKGKKKYYVRVRAYKTVNGKKYYGAWSKAKSVTTKK